MRNYFKYFIYLYVLIGFNSVIAGSYEDFFKAIEMDQPEVVSQLLARGFDPNSPSPKGTPAVILTHQKKSFKVLDVLVDWKKTNLNVLSADGETLLMLAAINNHLSLADKLIAKGADINKPGWTALHYAASKGYTKMIRLLLDQQAYVDAESPNGTTPLMMAAGYSNEMSVKLLLEEGADPRIRNKLGLSALDMARQAGKEDSTKYLQAFLSAWYQKYKPDAVQLAVPSPQTMPDIEKTQSTDLTQTQQTPAVQSRQTELSQPAEDEQPALKLQQTEQSRQAEEIQTMHDFRTPNGQENVADSSIQTAEESPQQQTGLENEIPADQEESLQEAVTGPAIPSNNIEINMVEPAFKKPEILPVDPPVTASQTVNNPVPPDEDKKITKEIISMPKKGSESSGMIRVRPLGPNSKKPSYTKQLQTLRIVTVDIIEVNNSNEPKTGQ